MVVDSFLPLNVMLKIIIHILLSMQVVDVKADDGARWRQFMASENVKVMKLTTFLLFIF